MKKILVVNVNWVGDVIFSAPVFQALKEFYPGSQVACLAVPRVKEICGMIPSVDEIILYDEKGKHWSPLAKAKLVLQLKQKRFDAVFLLHRSWTRALLMCLAGIPVRVGINAKKRGALLTHKVEPLEAQIHRGDHYLHVIESFGVKVKNRMSTLEVDHESSAYIDQLLKEKGVSRNDFLVVIHAGGNWNLKRWPKENFGCLIDQLAEIPNVKVALIGTQKDIALIQVITQMIKSKPFVFVGQTNLKQLAALLKVANCVISADSGPLHIANCVGTKTIALFGPTRPEVTGSRGKGNCAIIQHDVGCNHAPCYHLQCPDNICMKAISVYDVLKNFRQIKN